MQRWYLRRRRKDLNANSMHQWPGQQRRNDKLLLKAFQNAISNKELHNRWFSARDWCSVLPEYHGVLKGFEEQITTQKFTGAMNLIAHGVYTEESSRGIYSNKYGDNKQWYYMYTEDVRCPEPPTIDGFYPSNIKDFDTRQAVENTSTASSQSQSNNNNNDQAKKSEEVRRQTCFDQKEVFKIFMPKGTKFEDYDDPGKACLEAMAEAESLILTTVSTILCRCSLIS